MRAEIVEALKILNKALDREIAGGKFGNVQSIVNHVEKLAKLIKE